MRARNFVILGLGFLAHFGRATCAPASLGGLDEGLLKIAHSIAASESATSKRVIQPWDTEVFRSVNHFVNLENKVLSMEAEASRTLFHRILQNRPKGSSSATEYKRSTIDEKSFVGNFHQVVEDTFRRSKDYVYQIEHRGNRYVVLQTGTKFFGGGGNKEVLLVWEVRHPKTLTLVDALTYPRTRKSDFDYSLKAIQTSSLADSSG